MFFGENESWCDSKYVVADATDANAAKQLTDLNAKCKRTGVFDPWTIVGRIERGLVDDSALKNLVKTVRDIGKATPAPVPASQGGPNVLRQDMVTYSVIGVVGVLAAMLVFGGGKKGRGGSRRRRR